jgi:hypothetical protein
MTCNKKEDQLIKYLLNILEQAEGVEIENHLSSCQKCQRRYERLQKTRGLLRAWKPVNPPPDLKHKVMDDMRAQKIIEEKSFKKSLFITHEGKKTETQTESTKTTPMVLFKTISNYKITAFASAAVIIIGIVLGVNLINTSSTPGVAWGKLVEKIESIDFYSFKSQSISMDSKSNTYGFVTQQVDRYYISQDGFRVDHHYPWIFYDTITYASWLDKTFISTFPEIKKYTRTLLTDEYIGGMHLRADPRDFIKAFMSYNYRKLGRKIIEDQEVEGIEINDPKFGKFGFEGCIAQIWVNVATNLPVLFELEGTSGHGTVETKIVFDNFNWDGEYDSRLFEPDLSGYSLMAEVESMPINEESTIEALQRFSQLAEGKYPRSLDHTYTRREVSNLYYKMYKEKMGKGHLFWEDEDFDWEGYTSLHSLMNATCRFYAKLFNTDKEVVYHGEKVTADDLGLPLMRWKTSDDTYRVLFGDLRVEDVSKEKLTELEEPFES